jgi:gliding motility-associated-like protein
MAKRIVFILLLFLSVVQSTEAQKKLIGISGSNMLEINQFTGQGTVLRNLGVDFTGCASLVFLPHQQKFYTVSRINTSNLLISITIDGQIDTLGEIKVPGKTVYSIESIAYHDSDCGLYITASLDGGSAQGDWSAESIIYVDISTLNGTLITEYKSNAPKGGDADVSGFWNDTLFMCDADNTNYFYWHKVTFKNLPASITPKQVHYEKKYYAIGDLCLVNNMMFYPAEYKLYRFNPLDDPLNIQLIGTTHTSSLGPPIYMMALYDPSQEKFEIRDTTVCDTSNFVLSLPTEAKNIKWSTGATTRSITIQASGTYYVDFQINDCQWLSDSAEITVEDCDSCTKKQALYKDSLSLGNDTIICDGDPFLISLNIDGADRYVWDNGTTGRQVYADRTGTYRVSFWIGDCRFFSDSINITFVKCDTCDRIKMEALKGLNFEENYTFCRGDSVWLSVGNAPGFVSWNTGSSSRSIYAKSEGVYWAIFDTANCTFNSDTFLLLETGCELCLYYIPNAFSPNNDRLNPVFKVWFESTVCEPEIEMLIFNRWGEKLHHGTDNEWDGIYMGELSQVGVYMYIINISYPFQGQNIKKKHKGVVHLIR